MTWVDGVILAVLAVSALLALLRGLVHEVLGIAAWAGAIAAALLARPTVTPMLEGTVDPAWLADALATGGVFLAVLIPLKLIVAAIARRVQDSVLGGTDRLLGLGFGAARGAALVAVAYILGGMLLPATERWPEPVRDARALPLVVDTATWMVSLLPAEWRPRVAVPPDRKLPTMDDLLRPPARDRT